MDRSAEIPQQPGSSSGGSSPGSVTHPSCDGYPRTGIPVLNGTTVCEERDYFGLPAGNGVNVDTGIGDIEATNLSGSVIVGNGNGATTIDLGGAAWNGSGVQVVSGTGDTTFLVPSNYNAVFELQTATGSIHSDFGSAPQSEDYTGEQMTQVVGNGGATLSVQSGNGDITLRRKN